MKKLEVGSPILSGGKKFYPVIEWINIRILVGFKMTNIKRPIEIEYFSCKKEAEEYVDGIYRTKG